MDPAYETITINTMPGAPQRRKFQGRWYLVVNAVLLKEGVLNGSRGPLYYPPDEIAQNPGMWNHTPIVVWHPKDKEGRPTLARSPEVLEEYGIGLLFNDHYSDKTKTRYAEAWFDEERTKHFDQRLDNQHKILPRIRSGKSVELSTGLFTDNHIAAPNSIFNSEDGNQKPYRYIARNYRNDHLAALPDQKGACSVTDGCGFNVNSEEPTDNASGQPRSANTGQFKTPGSGYGKDPYHSAAQHGAMVLVQDDYDDGKDAHNQVTLKGHNPISWVADEGKWEKAKKAANGSGHTESEGDRYWAVVAHIYRQMGGKKKPTSNSTSNSEEPMTKEQQVTYLTTNCECWKDKESVLNGMTDAELESWVEFHKKTQVNEMIANGAKASGLTLNSEGKLEPQDPTTNEMKCPECGEMMEGNTCSCGYKKKGKKMMTGNELNDPEVKDQVCKSLFGMTANDAQAVLNTAKKIEQRERYGMVQKLTANLQDGPVKESKIKDLLKQPTKNLELLISLMPTQGQTQPTDNAAPQDEYNQYIQTLSTPSYIGSQGGPSNPTVNRDTDDKPDVDGNSRPMPILDYTENNSIHKRLKQQA